MRLFAAGRLRFRAAGRPGARRFDDAGQGSHQHDAARRQREHPNRKRSFAGSAKLPGGTLGDYESSGEKYQLFIAETESNQKAALLLLDIKGELASPEYIAYMGGYSGTLNGRPAFIFAKLQYLAGVIGLAKDKADPVARELAARLR